MINVFLISPHYLSSNIYFYFIFIFFVVKTRMAEMNVYSSTRVRLCGVLPWDHRNDTPERRLLTERCIRMLCRWRRLNGLDGIYEAIEFPRTSWRVDHPWSTNIKDRVEAADSLVCAPSAFSIILTIGPVNIVLRSETKFGVRLYQATDRERPNVVWKDLHGSLNFL